MTALLLLGAQRLFCSEEYLKFCAIGFITGKNKKISYITSAEIALGQTILLSQEPRSEPCLTKLVHFFIR